MTQIYWTSQAYADLDSIFDFLGRTSEHYAAAVVQKLVLAVGRLETFPVSGRVVPEYAREDVREVIHAPYRIVYRRLEHENEVHILMVYHAARQLPIEPPN